MKDIEVKMTLSQWDAITLMCIARFGSVLPINRTASAYNNLISLGLILLQVDGHMKVSTAGIEYCKQMELELVAKRKNT